MTRWIVLVAAATMVGCAVHVPVTLRGDVAFSFDERIEIERGNTWLALHVGSEPYAIVWDLPHPGDPSGGTDCSITRGVMGRGLIGYTTGNRRVQLDPDDAGEGTPLAVLAAHEFGHMAGLNHHEGIGIMNHELESALDWSDEDQIECLRATAKGNHTIVACGPK